MLRLSKFAVAILLLLVFTHLSAKADYITFTADVPDFVPNSATASPAYLAAQGAPTEFISFSVDKNGNPVSAGAFAGNIFSNNVVFSSGASAAFGGTNSANVLGGFADGTANTSEIGPVNGFNGILNINFLATGQTVTAVGFGTVELESAGETIRVYNGSNVLVRTFDASVFNTFGFFGVVGTNGDVIGRVELEGNFFAIQDLQYKTGSSAPVPEPATMLLLGTGLAGLGGMIRRRRQGKE